MGLVALGVLAFLLVSAALARLLAAGNAERAATVDIVRAEAAGDMEGLIGQIAGCPGDAACRSRTAAIVRRVRGSGRPRILRIDGPSALALGSRTATARVAWRVGERLPVVQCVALHRGGDLWRGFRVTVSSLSAPIARKSGCEAAQSARGATGRRRAG